MLILPGVINEKKEKKARSMLIHNSKLTFHFYLKNFMSNVNKISIV